MVAIQGQLLQVVQVAQLGWYRPGDAAGTEIAAAAPGGKEEVGQVFQAAQLDGQLAGQVVVPQVQPGDAAMLVNGNAVPPADWFVAPPVPVVAPVGAAQRVVQPDQDLAVGRLHVVGVTEWDLSHVV